MTANLEDLRKKIRTIILELAPENQGHEGAESSRLRLADDLGYNSLSVLELIFALEDELGAILIDDGAASFITTVHDVEEYVIGLVREQQATA
jgi:acyl carrier protein